MEGLQEGDFVNVKTSRGAGLFVARRDGLHIYLQEVEAGTVRRIAGRGGCVMAAKPGPGVTVERIIEGGRSVGK
jgi:hypothetical protein